MKLVSNKRGSTRERVDAEVDLLPVANWRPVWEDDADSGMVRANGRELVLSSRWAEGVERFSELRLTEQEAIGIAQVVTTELFRAALTAGKT